ncbi:MAG: polymerase subunit chi [Candidatus Midichloriaceae bacterium]|jgi:DNA polymerase-3 subunit chi|nr:polymerase subunit chi [Candidatus Midichloriaceae bacterium]
MQGIIYQSALPDIAKALAKLIETIWLKSNKILIYCKDKELLQRIDEVLWTYEQLSFLPHVFQDDEIASKTPVVLTYDMQNANSANILVCLEPTLPDSFSGFEKIIHMYSYTEGREKVIPFIQQLQSKEIEVIEYQQASSGAWQKIA